jgi:hypothetical protein
MTNPKQKAMHLRKSAQKLQQELAENGFVLVSQAAEQLHVPLATLADAARTQRITAIEVLPRRWFVSLAEVREKYGPVGAQTSESVLRQLEAAGVITTPAGGQRKRGTRRNPPRIDARSTKMLSEIVSEGRR